jgi:hypothetical protein
MSAPEQAVMTDPAAKPDITVAELREAFVADFGYDSPLFHVDLATLEDARERLEGGYKLFRDGYFLNGGRLGMLMSLEGAITHLMASLPAKELGLVSPLKELRRVLLDLEMTGNRAQALSAERRGNSDSDAVADVKARAIVIGDILKIKTTLTRKEADKLAADIISDAAAVAGITKCIDQKTIDNWRRSLRSRHALASKTAAALPEAFPKMSLADRVKLVGEEADYYAGLLFHWNGVVYLDRLFEMLLPSLVKTMSEASLALLRARARPTSTNLKALDDVAARAMEGEGGDREEETP